MAGTEKLTLNSNHLAIQQNYQYIPQVERSKVCKKINKIYNNCFIELIMVFADMDEIRRFDFKKYRFIWDIENKEFYMLTGIDYGINTHELHEQKGISARDQYLRRAVYGSNIIDVPLQTISSLIFTEVLNPFYVFEFFSFILWYLDDYLSYASAIFVMSLVSIITAVIQTRRNQRNLRSTVHSSDVANVLRENNVITVPTELLVPGDVLVIPSHGCVMHCDAVLLTGNCIVNESMLTG